MKMQETRTTRAQCPSDHTGHGHTRSTNSGITSMLNDVDPLTHKTVKKMRTWEYAPFNFSNLVKIEDFDKMFDLCCKYDMFVHPKTIKENICNNLKNLLLNHKIVKYYKNMFQI